MKKLLTKNIGLKILSFVLAVLLWLVVINIEDPYITDEIRNVPVEILNKSAFLSQDKVIEITQGETVNVKVRGKRKAIDNLRASDIKAYADLKDLTSDAYAVSIKVDTPKQIEKIEQTPETMRVKLEDIKTAQYPVKIQIDGNVSDNYVIDNMKVYPNVVEVTGPESQFLKISEVKIVVDVNNATNDVSVTQIPRIVDDKGNAIESITCKTKEVTGDVTILKKKTVPVNMKQVGDITEDYKVTSFSYEPKHVTIIGREQDLNLINEIKLPDYDVSGITEPVEKTITLSGHIPDKVKLLNPSEVIKLSIKMEKLIERQISIPIEAVDVRFIPADLQFRFITQEDLLITLKGLSSDISQLNASRVSARIDLSSLQPGVHKLEVNVYPGNNITIVGDKPTVDIELTEKQAETNQ